MSYVQAALESLSNDVAYLGHQADFAIAGSSRHLALESEEGAKEDKGIIAALKEKIAAMFKWLADLYRRFADWISGVIGKNRVKDAPKQLPVAVGAVTSDPVHEIPDTTDESVKKVHSNLVVFTTRFNQLKDWVNADNTRNLGGLFSFRIPKSERGDLHHKYDEYTQWLRITTIEILRAVEHESHLDAATKIAGFPEEHDQLFAKLYDGAADLADYEKKLLDKYGNGPDVSNRDISDGYQNVYNTHSNTSLNVRFEREASEQADLISKFEKAVAALKEDSSGEGRSELLKALVACGKIFRGAAALYRSMAVDVIGFGEKMFETARGLTAAWDAVIKSAEAVDTPNLDPASKKTYYAIIHRFEAYIG